MRKYRSPYTSGYGASASRDTDSSSTSSASDKDTPDDDKDVGRFTNGQLLRKTPTPNRYKETVTRHRSFRPARARPIYVDTPSFTYAPSDAVSTRHRSRDWRSDDEGVEILVEEYAEGDEEADTRDETARTEFRNHSNNRRSRANERRARRSKNERSPKGKRSSRTRSRNRVSRRRVENDSSSRNRRLAAPLQDGKRTSRATSKHRTSTHRKHGISTPDRAYDTHVSYRDYINNDVETNRPSASFDGRLAGTDATVMLSYETGAEIRPLTKNAGQACSTNRTRCRAIQHDESLSTRDRHQQTEPPSDTRYMPKKTADKCTSVLNYCVNAELKNATSPGQTTAIRESYLQPRRHLVVEGRCKSNVTDCGDASNLDVGIRESRTRDEIENTANKTEIRGTIENIDTCSGETQRVRPRGLTMSADYLKYNSDSKEITPETSADRKSTDTAGTSDKDTSANNKPSKSINITKYISVIKEFIGFSSKETVDSGENKPAPEESAPENITAVNSIPLSSTHVDLTERASDTDNEYASTLQQFRIINKNIPSPMVTRSNADDISTTDARLNTPRTTKSCEATTKNAAIDEHIASICRQVMDADKVGVVRTRKMVSDGGGVGSCSRRQPPFAASSRKRCEVASLCDCDGRWDSVERLPVRGHRTEERVRRRRIVYPRYPRPAYLFFTKEQRSVTDSASNMNRFQMRAYSRQLVTRWREMSGDDKQHYESLANMDRRRYEIQLNNYNEFVGEML